MNKYTTSTLAVVTVLLSLGALFWVFFSSQANTSVNALAPDSPQPTSAAASLTDGDVIPVDILNPDFPMTTDGFNPVNIGDGSLTYTTYLSLEEVMEFYRETYTAQDYTERKELTTASGETFKLVFGGDPSGQAVVILGEDLGDGSRTVTIRLEDV